MWTEDGNGDLERLWTGDDIGDLAAGEWRREWRLTDWGVEVRMEM